MTNTFKLPESGTLQAHVEGLTLREGLSAKIVEKDCPMGCEGILVYLAITQGAKTYELALAHDPIDAGKLESTIKRLNPEAIARNFDFYGQGKPGIGIAVISVTVVTRVRRSKRWYDWFFFWR